MADSDSDESRIWWPLRIMSGSNRNKKPIPLTDLAAAIQAFRQHAQLDIKTAATQWAVNELTLEQLESNTLVLELSNILTKVLDTSSVFVTTDNGIIRSSTTQVDINNIVAHSPLVAIRWRNQPGWPIEFVSDNVMNLLGYTAEELCREKTFYHELIHPEDLPHVIAMDESYLNEGILSASIEYRLMHRNGTSVHIIEYSSSVTNESGDVFYLEGIIHDVTELKFAQEQADSLTFYDPLTGLENRDLFKKRLEHVIKISAHNKTNAALLFLDIDRFKTVNDSLGHDAGDALLKIIADRLRKCLDDENTIARLGGDEFAIILSDVDAINSVDITAQNILNTLNTAIHLNNQDINVTVSIGITMIPDDGNDVSVLLKNAELAMYQSKSQGRNTYRFYINNMNEAVEERLFIQNGLRHAIDYNELVLFFQPQINLQNRKMTSMEALIRWRHPDRGMIPPKDFITVAEESGLIIDIGNWVLHEACKKAQDICQSGATPIKVCVNLSPLQFQDKNLIETVKRALTDTGLHPDYLELEITESMLMEDIDDALITLHELKKIGLSLSIDDFGTGYSSLSYLKRLPIDIVKVDQSFVRDIPHDLNDMEITAAVISMAHNLQLKVVAEGVETEDQQDFLTISKCDYAQGYFFSKPVPGDIVESIIRAHNNEKSPA